MSLDELVAHLDDGVDVQLGAGVGIQHSGKVDVLLLAGAGGLDGRELAVDVGHVQRRTLGGELTHAGGQDAAAVDEAGNLHTGLLGEVGDEVAGIQHVTADLIGRSGNHGLHDAGAVLAGASMGLHGAVLNLGVFLLPRGDLIDTAAGILVEGNIVALDEAGEVLLDEPRIVLGVMLAGLGAVVAETVAVEEAHLIGKVAGIGQLLLHTAAHLGVDVHAVLVPQVKEPRHVVDARDGLLVALDVLVHAHLAEDGLGADLHRVAETHRLGEDKALHIARKHGHGVGVIEKPGVGANLVHIVTEGLHNGNGTEGAHDAADAEGIGDGLTEAVLLGDLKIDNGAGIVASHLNGVDHKPGTAEGLLAVLDAEMGGNLSVAAHGLDHAVQDAFALLQTLGIDVVEGKFGVAECLGAEAVADDVAGKDGTACAHKGNFHSMFLSANRNY